MADIVTEESTTKSTFGNWQELHGNFLLRPSPSQGPPRALLHFLGGTIVGAAPQVMYRYMLERLANEGFLVVATPYSLSFDHLATCDIVIEKFERIAPMLARQYGAVPVVGVGHSCGVSITATNSIAIVGIIDGIGSSQFVLFGCVSFPMIPHLTQGSYWRWRCGTFKFKIRFVLLCCHGTIVSTLRVSKAH